MTREFLTNDNSPCDNIKIRVQQVSHDADDFGRKESQKAAETFTTSNLYKKLLGKPLKMLAQENEDLFIYPPSSDFSEDLDNDQTVLSYYQGKVFTQNIMGFISMGDDRLVISSRFSHGNGGKDYFLRYLLERTMTGTVVSDQIPSDPDSMFRQLLILIFPSYLQQATKQGVYRAYVRRSHNDSHVRGTIDVVRQIRFNTPFMGKIAYSTREYTTDNPLMHLIRHTLEYICETTGNRRLLNTSREIRTAVDTVIQSTPTYQRTERFRVLAWNRTHPCTQPFYTAYRKMQQLCIRILDRKGIYLDNDTDEVNGIIFDGAWLWEEYVNSIVGEDFDHPRNKAKSDIDRNVHHLFEKVNNHLQTINHSKSKSDFVGIIMPDFVSNQEHGGLLCVMDAKYKRSDTIEREDRFQILSYMLRFDARRGILIYPGKEAVFSENPDSFDPTLNASYYSLLQGRNPSMHGNGEKSRSDPNYQYFLMAYRLGIPKTQDFKSFTAQMKQREQRTVQTINQFRSSQGGNRP